MITEFRSSLDYRPLTTADLVSTDLVSTELTSVEVQEGVFEMLSEIVVHTVGKADKEDGYCRNNVMWFRNSFFSFIFFLCQIEEHKICVCVRKRPLNKKGGSHAAVLFLIEVGKAVFISVQVTCVCVHLSDWLAIHLQIL